MAFDGITIANIAQELNQTIVGGKINKIAQPENDELMKNSSSFRLCSRKRSAADSTAAGKQKKSEGNLKMSRGILTVVSGFSGAGKGTLMKRLMEEYDNYALSISVTTRDPRPGEEDGVSYFFRTEEEFDRMVEEDAFLEYARYVKHSYGTPKAYVEEQLDAGKDVLLEIEIQGALQVKEKRPDTLLVFITPPTAEELERRLRGRGTETSSVISLGSLGFALMGSRKNSSRSISLQEWKHP